METFTDHKQRGTMGKKVSHCVILEVIVMLIIIRAGEFLFLMTYTAFKHQLLLNWSNVCALNDFLDLPCDQTVTVKSCCPADQ